MKRNYGVSSHRTFSQFDPLCEPKLSLIISHFLSLFNSLFELEPLTKVCFGFDEKFDVKKQCSGLFRFGVLIHAQRMMAMLDSALGLLGPDHELLTEILYDAGARHVKFGVKVLGQALAPALSDALGSQWTSEVAQAWELVMTELGSDLMKAIIQAEQTGKAASAAVSMSSDASSSRSVITGTTVSSSFSSGETEVKEKPMVHRSPRKARVKLGRLNSMPRTHSSPFLGSGEVFTKSTNSTIADTQVYHSPRQESQPRRRIGLVSTACLGHFKDSRSEGGKART